MRKPCKINRPRVSITVSRAVREALDAHATAAAVPVSHIVDAALRRVFGMPPNALPPALPEDKGGVAA